jgi:putative thioredoxin
VRSARGALRLVKLDADKNPEITAQLRVRSLPTVFAIVKGRTVDMFSGVVPDDRLKGFFEKMITAAEAAGIANPPAGSGGADSPFAAAEEAVIGVHAALDAATSPGSEDRAVEIASDVLQRVPAVLAELEKLEGA